MSSGTFVGMATPRSTQASSLKNYRWSDITCRHAHIVNAPLGTIIIYTRNMERTAEFYSKYFGFETTGEVCEGLIQLTPAQGGAHILIHRAAKSVKLGQIGVKLSFDVQDVVAFVTQGAKDGLKFGAVHEASGYCFANAKDPDKNSVSISSRVFRDVSAQ